MGAEVLGVGKPLIGRARAEIKILRVLATTDGYKDSEADGRGRTASRTRVVGSMDVHGGVGRKTHIAVSRGAVVIERVN